MIQKWPIWMPVRGPRWCRFRVHKSVPFWANFDGPLTDSLWTPNRHSRGSVLQKEAFFFKNGPRTDFTQGVKCGPQTDCPAYIYIYIYARELAACPPFFCFKASWLSTFFFPFFSLTKKRTFPTRDWLISRPFRNTFQGQLVVHPLASWLSTFFGQFEEKMWTTSWLGGGQIAGLEICDCRP